MRAAGCRSISLVLQLVPRAACKGLVYDSPSMGLCVSLEQLQSYPGDHNRARSSVYDRIPEIARFKEQFSCLQLDDTSVSKLHRIFSSVDKDKSGSVDILELFMGLDIERNKFTRRVFAIFDSDGSSTIDFKEFVYSLWNYCTLAKSTLVLFAFDLYDKDDSGEIGTKECQTMLQDVYGKHWNTSSLALNIHKDLEVLDGIDLNEFSTFARTHPALLFPAFQMQEIFRRRILGVHFWEHLSEKRLEISKGKYISVSEFMFLHLEKDIFADFMMQTHRIDVNTFDAFTTNSKNKISPKLLKLLQDNSLRSSRHLKSNKGATVNSGTINSREIRDGSILPTSELSQESRKKPSLKSVTLDIKFMTSMKILTEGKDSFGAAGAVDDAKATCSKSNSTTTITGRHSFDGATGITSKREKTPRRSFDGSLPNANSSSSGRVPKAEGGQGTGRRSRESTPDPTPLQTPRSGEGQPNINELAVADRKSAVSGRRVSMKCNLLVGYLV